MNRVDPKLVSLGDPDPEVRKTAWLEVKVVKTWNERNFLRSLMRHRLRGVREEAWSHLDLYVRNGIDISSFFRSGSERVRMTAWQHYREALALGAITKEELRRYSNTYWRLLKSWTPGVMKSAWRLLPSLWRDGIVRDEERLISFLWARKVRIRLYAWETAITLSNEGELKFPLAEKKEAIRELIRKGKIGKRTKKILERVDLLEEYSNT